MCYSTKKTGENLPLRLFLDDQQDQCWSAILPGNLAQFVGEGDDKQTGQDKAIGYQESSLNALLYISSTLTASTVCASRFCP